MKTYLIEKTFDNKIWIPVMNYDNEHEADKTKELYNTLEYYTKLNNQQHKKSLYRVRIS